MITDIIDILANAKAHRIKQERKLIEAKAKLQEVQSTASNESSTTKPDSYSNNVSQLKQTNNDQHSSQEINHN